MSDYIRREDAAVYNPKPKSERDYQTYNLDDAYETGYDDKIKEILTLPATDVRDNVRGDWKHIGGDEWCCGFCGHVISTEGSWEHPLDVGKCFCENCGADNRGRNKEKR